MKAPTQEQLSDELDFEREQRESFVRELEDLEQQILDMGFRIMEKPARQASDRPIKPAAPEWVDGFPPVGGECWLSFHGSQPSTVKITYMGDGVFCYRTPSGMEYTGTTAHADFRPIRTQAERNRDALAGLCRAKFNQHTSPTNSHLWQQIADAIIAAGWRKGDS